MFRDKVAREREMGLEIEIAPICVDLVLPREMRGGAGAQVGTMAL